MIEGVKMMLGGREWIVPPLNLKALRRLGPKLKNLDGHSEESMSAMAETVHAALQRNYPDITIEQVEEMIDTSNMMSVMDAIMNSSGLVKTSGEPGEAPAASQ